MRLNEDTQMITGVREFKNWLKKAKKGDTIIYHIGNLAFDRENDHGDQDVLERLASEVWRCYEVGDLTLTQKKQSYPVKPDEEPKSDFIYLATRLGRC